MPTQANKSIGKGARGKATMASRSISSGARGKTRQADSMTHKGKQMPGKGAPAGQ